MPETVIKYSELQTVITANQAATVAANAAAAQANAAAEEANAAAVFARSVNVENIAALKAFDVTNIDDGMRVNTLGYYESGDGGGNSFYWNSNSLLPDNGGAVIAPNVGSGRWLAVLETKNARQFGFLPNRTASQNRSALQSCINWRNGGDIEIPAGSYDLNGVTNVPGKPISISGCGTEAEGTELKFKGTGALFTFDSNYFFTNLSVVGDDIDETIAFNCNSGLINGVLQNIKCRFFEYGVKFDYTMAIPKGTMWSNVSFFGMRTCGVKIENNGNYTLNQTTQEFDSIIITNSNRQGIPAISIIQTNDFTATTDRIEWNITNAKEFGWTIMRRVVGSTDTNQWEWVDRVNPTVNTYTASKTSGTYYNYIVLRTTVGWYQRYLKSTEIGSIQAENFALGLWIRNCWAPTIGSFYTEWKGKEPNVNGDPIPPPNGQGVFFDETRSFSVGSFYAEFLHDAVLLRLSNGNIDTGFGKDLKRSCIRNDQATVGEHHQLTIDHIIRAGTTPNTYSNNSNSVATFNSVGANLRVLWSTRGEFNITHETIARLSCSYRSNSRAWLESDASTGFLHIGGYWLWVDSNGVLRINNSKPGNLNTEGVIVGTQT
jgi:hypothetical protein